MGRHDSGETTGPFKRIRREDPTIPIPSAEVTKRRAWPVVLILTSVLVAAVALPVGLGNLSAEERPTPGRSAVSVEHSATPDPSPSASAAIPAPVRPTVTVTKNRIEYTPTPGPTITKTTTPPPKIIPVPGPTITVRITIKPKPVPTVTEIETIYVDRCFRVREGIMTGEIECP